MQWSHPMLLLPKNNNDLLSACVLTLIRHSITQWRCWSFRRNFIRLRNFTGGIISVLFIFTLNNSEKVTAIIIKRARAHIDRQRTTNLSSCTRAKKNCIVFLSFYGVCSCSLHNNMDGCILIIMCTCTCVLDYSQA